MAMLNSLFSCTALVFFAFALLVGDVFAAADFTGMTDIEVLMHEDRKAALDEFRRRAKDYPPEKVRAIEGEYLKRRRTPRARPVASATELLRSIAGETDAVRRMELFRSLRDRFKKADAATRAEIQAVFLNDWSAVAYPERPQEDPDDSWMRYREYACEAGVYLPTEEQLLSVLVDRCLNIGAFDEYDLFFTALSRAKAQLGEATAERVEAVYRAMNEERDSVLIRGGDYGTVLEAHQVLGRCGKPGVDAVFRLGTETLEPGIWALQINRAPEAEAYLWELYEDVPENHDNRRLRILRALSNKLGAKDGEISKSERFRTALTQYLKLPEGTVNMLNIQYAVALAEDTKDPYFLPQIQSLEEDFFRLDAGEYHCPGMDDQMDKALEDLRKHFSEAKARLERVAAAGAPEE